MSGRMLGPGKNVTTCCTWFPSIFKVVYGNFKCLYLVFYWELSVWEKVPRRFGRSSEPRVIWSSNTIDHPSISLQNWKNLEYPSIFEISKLWYWTWNFRKTTSKCFWVERNLLLTTSQGETRSILGFQMMEFQHLEFPKIYIFKTYFFYDNVIAFRDQNLQETEKPTRTSRNFFPLAELPITLKIQAFEATNPKSNYPWNLCTASQGWG